MCGAHFFDDVHLSFNGTVHVLQKSNKIWRPSSLSLQHSIFSPLLVIKLHPKASERPGQIFLLEDLKENHQGCLQKQNLLEIGDKRNTQPFMLKIMNTHVEGLAEETALLFSVFTIWALLCCIDFMLKQFKTNSLRGNGCKIMVTLE